MSKSLIQTLIDKIRRKPKFLFIEDYVKKLLGLKEHKGEIETLILGSSHIQVGYIPQGEFEYNCGLSAQDFLFGLRLYQYTNSSKLKNIIISYSTFSSYNDLLNSPTPYLPLILKILLGVDYNPIDKLKIYRMKNYEFSIKRVLKKLVKRVSTQYDLKNYNGTTEYPDTIYEENELETATFALSDSNRIYSLKHFPLVYFQELIKTAENNNQNVYVVITPIIDKLFKDLMPDEKNIFRELYKFEQNYKNVKILNFYNDSRFEKNEFYDWQHLNYKGAQKLTTLIRKEIL